MNSGTSRHDELLLDRFLDGVLPGDELAGCRRRLEHEPALRAALQQRQQLRAGFHAARGSGFTPSAHFVADVVAAARRLPPLAGGDTTQIIRLCRRILLAAAALLAAGLLWHSRLFADNDDGKLQAAPDEVKRVIEDLDARIRAAAERAAAEIEKK